MTNSDTSFILSPVYGQSMFPALKHKDKVLIKKMASSKIKVRDIIVYENEYRQTVAHRVTKIVNRANGLVFYTKGDFSRTADRIRGDKVSGKVVGVYRGERLKTLSFENSLIFYLIINILSLSKELLKKLIERAYSFVFIRKIVKLSFSLDVNFLFIEDVKDDDDFRSFYNFCPSLGENYVSTSGFLAKCKNMPVGKIWILKDRKDNYFLYGPYVKVLYRARNIGSSLIKKTLTFLKDIKSTRCAYAFIFPNKALMVCFKKLDFVLKKVGNKRCLFKKFL